MMYKAGPILPVSGTAQDESFFPVRITSALIANQYTFVEVWTTPGGVIADKVGGRFNSYADPAYAIDGSTFSVTAAGSAVQVLARRSAGSGGVGWELKGSNPLPTVYASDGSLTAGVGYSLMDAGSRTVPRGDYLAISTFGASFRAPGGGIPTFPVFVNAHFALGMWDASVNPPVSYFIRSTAYRVTEVAGSDVTAPPPQANRFSFYTMNQSFSRGAQDALIPGTGPIKIGLFYEVLFGIGQVLPYDHSLSLVPCLLPDE